MSGYRLNPDCKLAVVPPMEPVSTGIPMPPSADERVARFRRKWQMQRDYCRAIHDAQIAGGVVWLDHYRKRPIPRHRALIPHAGESPSL